VRILWILDTRFSALSISAQSKGEIGSEFIYADEFFTLGALTRKLHESDSDLIIFSWRKVLGDITKSRRNLKLFSQLPESKKVAVLIPDLMDASIEGIESNQNLFAASDCILTTNQQLLITYKGYFGPRKEIMLLLDTFPLGIQNSGHNILPKKPGQVIWVGNSKWGSKQGFVDHKGFESVIKPLSEMCAASDCNHSYVFVDSAIQRLRHSEVMNAIGESEYLLQASESEGTGMPLLEALHLNTVPLTTDVGIAREVLGDRFSCLIVERSPESFFKILHQPKVMDLVGSGELSKALDSHFNPPANVIFSEIMKLDLVRCFSRPTKVNPFGGLEYALRFLRSKCRIIFFINK